MLFALQKGQAMNDMENSMNLKLNRSGFTALELLVVMGIISLAVVVALPNLLAWLPNHRLKMAANEIHGHLQLAKLTAVRSNNICAVSFFQNVGGDAYDYVVYEDADGDLEYDIGETPVRLFNLSDYPGVSLDVGRGGVTFPNNDENHESIGFQPNGLPRNNAGGFGAGSVFLRNGMGTKRAVVVSAAGNIRVDTD
jgi:prepilin-type N-terminal cleavage/methylation domain-containing protein